MKKVCNVNNGKTSGSALVIVLGILSVLMLMSVAFSTFMRTERGATTNLKNAHVAEQALHSALAAAIQSIDDSLAETQDGHGNAVVDSPVVVWPQPWLASCAPADRGRNTDGYFQSRFREGTDPVPNVLCSGAAEFLTSNQIAMVRSAAVGWAPLYSGIGVSSNGLYGAGVADKGVDAGYPDKEMESIVGRYAFVALDTTGYLDPGKIGDLSNLNNALDARKESSGDDPWRFVPVDGGVKAKTPGGTEIPNPLVSSGRSKLANLLKDAKAFFSFADAKAKKDAGGFNWTKPAQAMKKNLDFMPPDLYAGTGVSLAPLNPEGEPKVVLPYGEDGADLTNDEDKREDLAKRIYPAMVSVFARSRKAGGVEKWEVENKGGNQDPNDSILLYYRTPYDLYVPKAALATVGLLDAVDGDAAPGKKVGKGDGDSYWAILAGMGDNIEVKVWDDNHSGDSGDVLRSVKSGISGALVENPLDYPCTVGAPLLKTFYAYVTIDKATEKTEESRTPSNMASEGKGYTAYKNIFETHCLEYEATLHVGAIAADENFDDTDDPRELDYDLEVTYEVMADEPSEYGTVSAGSTENGTVRKHIESPLKSGTQDIKWIDFWKERKPLTATKRIREGIGDGDRFINVQDSYSFTIQCGVKDVEVVGTYTNITYFPPTYNQYLYEKYGAYADQEKDKGEEIRPLRDVWVPIRFKATVTTEDKDEKGKVVKVPVQRVPAPRLDEREGGDLKQYWVRVDAGVYHGGDQSVVSSTGGTEVQSKVGNGLSANIFDDKNKISTWTNPDFFGALAQGWAECLAPQFGMDTTSLTTSWDQETKTSIPTWDANHKFWINNVCARGTFDDPRTPEDEKADIFDYLRKTLDASDSIEYKDTSDEEIKLDKTGLFIDTGSAIRKPVAEWLLDDSVAKWYDLEAGLWSGWFNAFDSSCADMMHRISDEVPDDDWVVKGTSWGGNKLNTNSRRIQDIYTRFRTGGIKSVADLGSILIGPYETLSLFQMWRPPQFDPAPPNVRITPISDFHPVFDYFTMDEDRYPTDADMIKMDAVEDDGSVDWDKLGDSSEPKNQRHLFSAVQNGRVNLNLPRLLKWESVKDGPPGNPREAVRVRRADEFNPYPLAAALNGAPYPSETGETNSVTEPAAVDIASAYAKMLHDVAENKAKNKSSTVTNTVELASSDWMPAVRDVSFFASGGEDENPVLQAFLDNLPSKDRDYACDDMREGFLRGVSDAFTTRGQSFLLVLRADAYTARFGQQENTSGGTSLASSYALVELFRDPEPARLPDGTFPRDADGNPVLYHNWFIRSFRLF